ncbi:MULTISPECIES: N-acetylmuramate alpha-1-phosphate uridylyltransferase MurU [unclassified Caulobacter]|jgi:MurNAc alpha-1-phosphate uridylyltransferase|uniref:N-acetylmuramate alpha-1-phosphate uridylyltransferase MurU n=1 Tax=unclassified Caulobacter TaxID=2648921 RepID=UPI0006F56810|nr:MULTISPECIES: nucleotidyltransferase family protein [unclassified Caulobacter]KQV55453.1 mannose-1-phosphate guanylyltransferase [Caulobacter sp. Root342]KQV71638.1 mannose-1-phosphate guanylyltransferase [Caulobacter sp. Root343]
MSGPKTAMVLAAGLGTRMRPLTDDRPKALVEVAGKALIDHMLDRLAAAGVETAVVNVHYFADLVEAHLRAREAKGLGPRIVISDERAQALETGGGIKHALPLLGDGPVFVANIDSVWIEHAGAAIDAVAAAWNPEAMDVCLMLASTGGSLGFHDSGDVFLAGDGVVRFKDPGEIAPLVYVGVHICKPAITTDGPEGPFSLLPLWKRLAADHRVHGVAPDGLWMHVGDPDAKLAAEARLSEE